ncbi:MAG: uridine phosphorylase [bacterium]|nr:uridine phosphorylase [bacterium]
MGLKKTDLKGAVTALLPGDPDRVPMIASYLSNAREVALKREFKTFFGYINKIPVIVTSTGIGGPSTSICVEELAQLGVRDFIRVGSTCAIQENIAPGDIIIPTAAVRLDGSSTDFAPIQFPAVGDFHITNALIKSAGQLKLTHHVGICATTSTFYQGQERYDSFSGNVPSRLQGCLKEWQSLGVLNFEMEAAPLFTMCSTMGLKAGCVCGVVANRTNSEAIVPNDLFKQVEKHISRIAINAVRLLKEKH